MRKSQVEDALVEGTLVRYEGRVWMVGMVNDCRARLDPITGYTVAQPLSGRTFQSYGSSVNIAPGAMLLDVVDPATLALGERQRYLTLVERKLEAEMAVAETPVGKAPAGTAGAKNKAANDERKAKLAQVKAEKAATRAATAKPPKEPKPCKCGCGQQTGGFFVPGHDAKFKSWLLQIERGKAKPEDLLKPAVYSSYKWKKTADGKGLMPTTNYKGEPHNGYDTATA